eukprot:611949_1
MASFLKTISIDSLYSRYRWFYSHHVLGSSPIGKAEQRKHASSHGHEFWNCCAYNEDGAGLIDNLRIICLRYVGIDMNNNILSNKEQLNWIGFLASHTKCNADLALLYRGSETVFDIDTLRKICEDKKHIVILLRNKYDHVLFGGYSSVGRIEEAETESMIQKASNFLIPGVLRPNYVSDDKAFLYRWTKGKEMKFPEIFKVRKGKEHHAIPIIDRDPSHREHSIFYFGTKDLLLDTLTLKDRHGLRIFCEPYDYRFKNGEELCRPGIHHLNFEMSLTKFLEVSKIFSLWLVCLRTLWFTPFQTTVRLILTISRCKFFYSRSTTSKKKIS